MNFTTRLLAGHLSAVLALALLTATPATAGLIEIQLNGVHIAYDDTDTIFDADPGGGDPDPLVAVNFIDDGVLVGTLTSDISLDLSIPEVTDIPVTGGTVTSDPGGFFDLDFGPSGSLSLSLDAASITYVDVPGIVQFTFGGAAASIDDQDLPFGLIIGEPITVSFSTPVVPGTLTDDSTFVTGFEASGTGEVRGPFVPEPGSLGLVALLVSFATMAFARKRLG